MRVVSWACIESTVRTTGLRGEVVRLKSEDTHHPCVYERPPTSHSVQLLKKSPSLPHHILLITPTMEALQADGQTRPAFFRLPLELRQEIYSLAYPLEDKPTVDLWQYTESVGIRKVVGHVYKIPDINLGEPRLPG